MCAVRVCVVSVWCPTMKLRRLEFPKKKKSIDGPMIPRSKIVFRKVCITLVPALSGPNSIFQTFLNEKH